MKSDVIFRKIREDNANRKGWRRTLALFEICLPDAVCNFIATRINFM